MSRATNYARNLMVAAALAGVMLLTPAIALAQQEINPDHFDGDTPKVTQARPAAEHRKQGAPMQKQAAAMQKTSADSKHRQKMHDSKPAAFLGGTAANHR